MFNTTLLKSPHCIESTKEQHLENWSMITMKGKVPFSHWNGTFTYTKLHCAVSKKEPQNPQTVLVLGM